jgi:hypothetical protein
MKLGATITSERGKAVTKTGNERIEIEIVGEDRERCIGRIVYQMAGNDYIISISLPNGYQTTERIKTIGNLKHGKCTIDTWDTNCKGCAICKRKIEQD